MSSFLTVFPAFLKAVKIYYSSLRTRNISHKSIENARSSDNREMELRCRTTKFFSLLCGSLHIYSCTTVVLHWISNACCRVINVLARGINCRRSRQPPNSRQTLLLFNHIIVVMEHGSYERKINHGIFATQLAFNVNRIGHVCYKQYDRDLGFQFVAATISCARARWDRSYLIYFLILKEQAIYRWNFKLDKKIVFQAQLMLDSIIY